MNSLDNRQSLYKTLPAFFLSALLVFSPGLAHAHSTSGYTALAFVMFIGIPYGLVLIIFGFMAIAKLGNKEYSAKTRRFGRKLFVATLVSCALFLTGAVISGADLNWTIGLQLSIPNTGIAIIVAGLGFALSKMTGEHEDQSKVL